MMKHFYSLFLLLLPILLCAQTYDYTWARRGGGSGEIASNASGDWTRAERVLDMATDSQNNYYFIAYVANGNPDFDGNSTSSYSDNARRDLVLYSTDCDGSFRWSRTFGSENSTFGGHLLVDANDDVYVSGELRPKNNPSGVQQFINFDTDSIVDTSQGQNDPGIHNKVLFLIKYDSSGNFLWLRQPQRDQIVLDDAVFSKDAGLQIDTNGNIKWLARLGLGTHLNGQYTDPGTSVVGSYLIITYDGSGNYLNNTVIGLEEVAGAGFEDVEFAFDPANGQSYISGNRAGNGTGSGYYGTSFDNASVLLAVDAQGSLLWSHENQSGQNLMHIQGIALDGQSNIYLTGGASSVNPQNPAHTFAGYGFDMTNNAGSDSSGSFVIKLDSSGSLVWGSNHTMGSGSRGYAFSFHNNEVALACGLGNDNSWGNFSIQRAGDLGDPTVVRFDRNNGNVLGLHHIATQSAQQQLATAIATDVYGNYVVGGFFTGSAFTGHPSVSPLTNQGGSADFFVARLATTDCSGQPLGLASTELSGVELYPNPVRDHLNIASEHPISGYRLRDISGRMLRSGDRPPASIDLGELPPGIYFLELESQGGTGVYKLVKR